MKSALIMILRICGIILWISLFGFSFVMLVCEADTIAWLLASKVVGLAGLLLCYGLWEWARK